MSAAVPTSTPPASGGSVRMWPLYVGGFLGPFGGSMVQPMLPELAAGLDTTLGTAASAITWYMLPFAAMMIASGTVARRWGQSGTIKRAFLLYAGASVVCILSSSTVPFMAGRGLQGVANAFTTPLIVALIATLVPVTRLGQALGMYASMQAAGQAFAPLIGGFAAAVDYRWAFGGAAAAALFLAAAMPDVPAGTASAAAASPWRALANLRLARAAFTAAAAQFSVTALMMFTALLATDRFGLAPDLRGVVVAAFGVAGLIGGRPFGRVADRFGMLRVGVVAVAALAASVAALGFAPSLAVLVALTALAGLSGTGCRMLTNTLALRSTPANRSGATSVSMSAQFLGSAAAPLLLSTYLLSPGLAGLIAGAVTGLGALVAASGRGRTTP